MKIDRETVSESMGNEIVDGPVHHFSDYEDKTKDF